MSTVCEGYSLVLAQKDCDAKHAGVMGKIGLKSKYGRSAQNKFCPKGKMTWSK